MALYDSWVTGFSYFLASHPRPLSLSLPALLFSESNVTFRRQRSSGVLGWPFIKDELRAAADILLPSFRLTFIAHHAHVSVERYLHLHIQMARIGRLISLISLKSEIN